MKRRAFLASPLALLVPRSVYAVDYPIVVPDRPVTFPQDFGSHPAFRNEWWYVTGWVRAADGRELGVQVTFFRNRPAVAEDNPSRFAPRQLLFAHAAIADPRHGRLRHDQRAARAGFGLAEAAEQTTDVRIDDWSLRLEGDRYVARIAAREFRFALYFTPTQPPLAQGVAGYSRKGPSAAQASYYYSQPQLAVSGEIALADDALTVVGTAWLDHEWSSESLGGGAVGWDWVGLNLDDGSALMAFRMRDQHGEALWAGGSIRHADGGVRRFAPEEVRFDALRRWRSPRTGVVYPVAVRLNAGDEAYEIAPLLDDQELDSRESTGTVYWEGAVHAAKAGREVGRGYLELTGYGQPLRL
jgi:predicted secreted hydrolase